MIEIIFGVLLTLSLLFIWVYCVHVSLTSDNEKEARIFGFYSSVTGIVLGIMLTVTVFNFENL